VRQPSKQNLNEVLNRQYIYLGWEFQWKMLTVFKRLSPFSASYLDGRPTVSVAWSRVDGIRRGGRKRLSQVHRKSRVPRHRQPRRWSPHRRCRSRWPAVDRARRSRDRLSRWHRSCHDRWPRAWRV
jgi:hypothetical protein